MEVLTFRAAEVPQLSCPFFRSLLALWDALAKGDADARGCPPLLGTTRCTLALLSDGCAGGRLLENACTATTPVFTIKSNACFTTQAKKVHCYSPCVLIPPMN